MLKLRTTEDDESSAYPKLGTVVSPSKENTVFEDAFHGKRI